MWAYLIRWNQRERRRWDYADDSVWISNKKIHSSYWRKTYFNFSSHAHATMMMETEFSRNNKKKYAYTHAHKYTWKIRHTLSFFQTLSHSFTTVDIVTKYGTQILCVGLTLSSPSHPYNTWWFLFHSEKENDKASRLSKWYFVACFNHIASFWSGTV